MSPELLEVEKEHHIAFVTRPFGGDRVNAYEIAEVDAAHFKEADDPINILSPDADLIVMRPVQYDSVSPSEKIKAAVHCVPEEVEGYPLHLEVIADPEIAASRGLKKCLLTAALETIEEHHPEDAKRGIWIEKPQSPKESEFLTALGFKAVNHARGQDILVKTLDIKE